jgi:hypothetical protein
MDGASETNMNSAFDGGAADARSDYADAGSDHMDVVVADSRAEANGGRVDCPGYLTTAAPGLFCGGDDLYAGCWACDSEFGCNCVACQKTHCENGCADPLDGNARCVDRPDVGVDRPDVGVDRPDVGVDRPDVGVDRPDVGVDRPDVGVDRSTDSDSGSNASLELLSWIQSVGGTPIRVLKRDQYVFLGDWDNRPQIAPSGSLEDGSIQTYTVADPLQPMLGPILFTPGDQIQDLAIEGPWLFAANDAQGLRLVDISSPFNLKSVAARSGDGPYATSVAVTVRVTDASQQLYALVGYLYGGGLEIHAVPDGGPIPAPVRYTSTALPSRCDVYQILVRGDRAYIFAGDGASLGCVEILDISQLPAVPTALGRLCLPFATYGSVGDIRLSGDLLYFSASDYSGGSGLGHMGGLRIIDVQNPAQPVLVGTLDLPPAAGAIPWKGTGLAVAGQEVFFVGPSGVRVIDVSAPSLPTLRSSAPFPATFGVCQGGTAVIEADLLYVGAYCSTPGGRGGLVIYRRH